MQDLLAKSNNLNFNLKEAFEEKDCGAMKLDIQFCKMRVEFKMKAFKQIKRKVMREENSDESSLGTSIVDSELNDLEEQCKHQKRHMTDIELLLEDQLLLDDSYYN